MEGQIKGDRVAWDPIVASAMAPGSAILKSAVREGVPVGTVLEVFDNGDVRVKFDNPEPERIAAAADTDPDDGVCILTAQEILTIDETTRPTVLAPETDDPDRALWLESVADNLRNLNAEEREKVLRMSREEG